MPKETQSKTLNQMNTEQKKDLERIVDLLTLCARSDADSDNSSCLNKAIEIKKRLDLPLEIYQSEEIQNVAKKAMTQFLAKSYLPDYISLAIKVKEEFGLSQEDVYEITENGIIQRLAWWGEVSKAVKIRKEFDLPLETAQQASLNGLLGYVEHNSYPNHNSIINEVRDKFGLSQEMVFQAVEQRINKYLSQGYVSDAVKLKERFELPQGRAYKLAEQSIINKLSEGWTKSVIRIKEEFDLPQKIIHSKEIQESAKKSVLNKLSDPSYGVIEGVEIKKEFDLPQKIIHSKEIQEAAKQGMITALSQGWGDYALNIKKEFELPSEAVHSKELQEAAKQGLVKKLSGGYVNDALSIKEGFDVPQEIIQSKEVQQAAKQGIIKQVSEGEISRAIKIKEDFDLLPEIIYSQEMQEKVREKIVSYLTIGYGNGAISLKKTFDVPLEFIYSQIVQRAAEEGLYKMLGYSKYSIKDLESTIENAIKIKEEFDMPINVVQDAAKKAMIEQLSRPHHLDFEIAVRIKKEFFEPTPEFNYGKKLQDAVKQGIINQLSSCDLECAIKIKNEFNLSMDVAQEAAKQGIVELFSKINRNLDHHSEEYHQTAFRSLEEYLRSIFKRAEEQGMVRIPEYGPAEVTSECVSKFRSEFNVPMEFMQQIAKQNVMFYLSQNYVNMAINVKKDFNLPKKIFESADVQEAALEGIINRYLKNDGSNFIDACALEIKEKFGLPDDFGLYSEYAPTYIKSLIPVFELENLIDLLNFLENNKKYFRYLNNNPHKPVALEKKDVEIIPKLYISLIEAEEVKRKREDILTIIEADKDYETLFNCLEGWSKEWQDKENVVKPFKRGADIFGYEKMFAYAYREDMTKHDALHAFDKIVQLYQSSGLSPDKFYGNILHQVRMDNSIYSEGTSYHYLNMLSQGLNLNFKEVLSVAKRYESINCLKDLIKSLDSSEDVFTSWKNLKKYSELAQLVQRTEILDQLKKLKEKGKEKLYNYIEKLAFHPNIDMPQVFEFWMNPEKFLSVPSSRGKKPSNYIDIPNLDLTAEELRDALVECKMDALQVFPAMEIVYEIPKEKGTKCSARENVKVALGSRKENVRGKAKNPEKLFSKINNLLKTEGVRVQDYIEGEELSEDLDTMLEQLVFDPSFGMAKPKDVQIYVAKINLKSDPDGVVAGNDTACCMPFGSGINTDYTFNPNTALFTLQVKIRNNSIRTIAQSVLTKDKDIHVLISEARKKVESEGSLVGVVPEDVLADSLSYLACDNIEVALNFRKDKAVIEMIYQDFFREYLSRFAEVQKLKATEVIIGLGHSDALTHLPKKPNTFVPLAPVGYSDKFGNEVLVLDLLKKEKIKKSIKINKESEICKTEGFESDISGVEYLTFQNVLPVSYLESKIYSDNKSLISYLHNIESCLIAKDINNTLKNRPNMSLKYKDQSGKVKAYLIAYEGKLEEKEDMPIVYISDLASDTKLGGGKLIKGFIQLYKQNYLNKGSYLPVYMEARDTTTYQLIKKQIERIGKSLGVGFEIEEFFKYQEGKDTMRPIMIKPKPEI